VKSQFDVGLRLLDMKISRMSFDGAILERGYWVYVILIYHKSGKMHLYIGRTGDQSSQNAGSPFQRVANHLNLLPSAPMSAIKRLIKQKGYKPSACQFRLIAKGPLFSERKDEQHWPIRNKMTALEKSIASHFCSKGYDVLGKHDDNQAKDPELFKKVISSLEPEIQKEVRQFKKPCKSVSN
jgi:hypothetical protein